VRLFRLHEFSYLGENFTSLNTPSKPKVARHLQVAETRASRLYGKMEEIEAVVAESRRVIVIVAPYDIGKVKSVTFSIPWTAAVLLFHKLHKDF